MKKDTKSENAAEPLPNEMEKMDRRNFIVTAGKMVIPTLAIIGLSLSGLTGRAQADGCSDCNHNCKDSCAYGCSGDCKGDCSSSCSGGCSSSCKGASS